MSAPVGYGKTTLLRLWCIERPEPVVWMTLDAADDDPVRLWMHLATAVDRLREGLGNGALTCLGVRGVPVETAVDELMNALVRWGRPVTIVLDDLHSIGSELSLGSIGHAIERLPGNARLLAATRSDPAIAIARLRARGELTEVRARELAFTVDESRELIEREGIDVSAESVELLVERTEGWPAGLYLAALWLRDLEDPDEGVRAFAGSNRHVADYLTDEVLSHLAPETRDFLLRTSVLNRLTPELCDFVLDREDSAAVLAELARSNMFLVALDTREEWYRYHHLFGELLQLELGRKRALGVYRRAADWCRAHGLVEDAIEYAAAAGDAERVAELLVEHDLEFGWGGRLTQFLGWLEWLPSELLAEHPSLPAAGAIAAALLGRPEVEAQRLLAVAEQRADASGPSCGRRSPRGSWKSRGRWRSSAVTSARPSGTPAGRSRPLVRSRPLARAQTSGASARSRPSPRRCSSPAILTRRGRSRCRPLSDPRPRAAPRATSPASGCSHSSTPNKAEHRAPRRGLLRRSASRSKRFQADSWRVSLAHLGLALAATATGRLDDAEREALRGERLRRSPQPTVGHAHALLVLAHVRVARSRLSRAASDLKHAQQMIAEFPDPGRLPAIAATVAHNLTAATQNKGNGQLVEELSPGELAVLLGLATGRSRREIGAQLYISLNTVKSRTRQLYRKLGATSRAEAVARAEALGLLDRTETPG